MKKKENKTWSRIKESMAFRIIFYIFLGIFSIIALPFLFFFFKEKDAK
jgi:hypothetical protein